MFPHGETITIERQSAQVNRYGDRGPVIQITVKGVGFAPRQGLSASSELSDQRNTVISGYTMYVPAGTEVLPSDVVIRAGGVRYEVDGEPGVWQNPFTGWSPGVEVALKRVSG